MRIRLFCSLPAIVLSGFVIMAAYSQEDMRTVENSGFKNPARSAAAFLHEEHNEKAGLEECNACHHVYDKKGMLKADESSEDQKCSDCHGLETSGRQPSLMSAFHKNCKGCHMEKKAGPILCGECHKKKQSDAGD